MRAMLLAAGKGERMRPLTLERPKPLLEIAGKPLIAWHLANLAAAGIKDVVINVSWLGDQIIDYCGAGDRWGLHIGYSEEAEALETAGGILQALPQLGDAPFIVLNADVWTDFPIVSLRTRTLAASCAHLVMVDNPAHHPDGDFALRRGRLETGFDGRLTFSGVGLYHPAFFAGYSEGKRPLLPLLQQAMAQHRLLGEHYRGAWTDVGTPQRLDALNQQYTHAESSQN
ncbi:MAG: N-acetylmuramate alpha-1-phosphate uridylyltransferase MurU [Congregibacter sp.]